MARMTKRERRERLGRVIEAELSRAENRDDGSESSRRRAVRDYLCKPRGDEIKDRSSAISSDVRDMINAVLAMLVPMISTDSIVEFEPLSEADQDPAQAESDVLNKLIMEDNRGSIEIQEALKDGLLLRNGAMKMWLETRQSSDVLDVAGLGDEDKRAIGNRMEMADPGARARVDGDQIHVTRETRRFRVAAVPIENLCWSSGSGELQERRFFAEAMDISRSDLIARGIPRDVVEGLGTSSAGRVRDRRRETDDGQGETEDQEIIGCHEAYLLIDQDGDGISERWRVLVANENEVLEEELVALIPYALGAPFLNPHRLEGESLADNLAQVQDAKTYLLRQFEDNVAALNNGKFVYDPARVNEGDILNPVPGGGIRARDVAAVMPLAIPDVTAGILAALTVQDKRRTEAGGAALDMMQADIQLAGETAWGTERQYASRELLVSLMASNFGETLLRGLYTMGHAFIRAYAVEPFMVRLRGQFVQVDARQWPERTRLNVTVGKTPGQRGHMQQTLAMHMQMQAQAMAAGMDGILANAQTLHATARAWLRMAGIENPDAMLLDPASQPAQQSAQEKAQQAQALQQQQMALQQQAIALENRKLDIEERKNSGELSHKYFQTETQMAMKEAELVGGAAVDLEKQSREAAATAQREAAAARNASIESDKDRAAAAARPQ